MLEARSAELAASHMSRVLDGTQSELRRTRSRLEREASELADATADAELSRLSASRSGEAARRAVESSNAAEARERSLQLIVSAQSESIHKPRARALQASLGAAAGERDDAVLALRRAQQTARYSMVDAATHRNAAVRGGEAARAAAVLVLVRAMRSAERGLGLRMQARAFRILA